MHDVLYELCRAQEGREASPTAAIIDSQSVKSSEKGGSRSIRTGYGGKKIMGKKRHILVTHGGLLLIIAIVHSASIQDRDGGVLLFSTLLGRFPFLEKLFADSAYQATIFATAIGGILPGLHIEIVKPSDRAKGS